MEDEMDVSSIDAQYSDQTIMDIYSDFDIQPQTMNIDNFDDMDISSTPQPISKTTLLSSSKVVLPMAEYEYIKLFETVPATSLGLNQNYNKPVTHSYYDPADLQYVSPIIHPSMDFSLDITDQIGEEHVASKTDSRPTTASSDVLQSAENLNSLVENTHHYPIPESILATALQTLFAFLFVYGFHEYSEDVVKGMHTELSMESACASSSSFAIGPAIEVSDSFKLKCPFHYSNITSGLFDHNGGILISENGMKITFLRGAIRYGDKVYLQIAMGLYGPFILPSSCQGNLASPYYWVGVRRYYFQVPVQVEF